MSAKRKHTDSDSSLATETSEDNDCSDFDLSYSSAVSYISDTSGLTSSSGSYIRDSDSSQSEIIAQAEAETDCTEVNPDVQAIEQAIPSTSYCSHDMTELSSSDSEASLNCDVNFEESVEVPNVAANNFYCFTEDFELNLSQIQHDDTLESNPHNLSGETVTIHSETVHSHWTASSVHNLSVFEDEEQPGRSLTENSSTTSVKSRQMESRDLESSIEFSSDSDSNFEEEEEADTFCCGSSPPIYKDAPITVHESMTAILAFALSHSLDGKTISDLLQLISLHCRPEESKFKTSLYFFKKNFCNVDSPVFHHFCSHCYTKLESSNRVCPMQNLHPNSPSLTSYFVETPLIPQLQSMFQREGFVESFQHRFQRDKKAPYNIEDVYDGQLYKEQVASDFLSERNKFNFSMQLAADGVPVFRSSKSSLWPLYFSIHELPIQLRFKRENTLIGGLWFGQKPIVNAILQPLKTSLTAIRQGFSFSLAGDSEVSHVAKGVLLTAVFDLPAKCAFLGMSQYNGNFGCQICKQQGESVFIPRKKNSKVSNEMRGSSSWVYRYMKDLELRQHQETVIFGERALELYRTTRRDNVNIFGVKYPSLIFKLMPDVIRGVGIDDLHTVILGVGGKFMDLWFNTKYSGERFSVVKFLDLVDTRLCKICPPNFLQRSIRGIADHYAHWKGSELMHWLLYYSIPVLQDLLPIEYLSNYVDFVSSVYECMSPSICPDKLLECSHTLDRFVQTFQNLYGLHHMSMNIHLMQHLTYVVNNLGPLFCYSSFPYENLNGEFLKMIHGTRYVEVQLSNRVFMGLYLSERLKCLNSVAVKTFCHNVMHPSLRLKKNESIQPDMFTVGIYRALDSLNDKDFIQNALGAEVVQGKGVSVFPKLKKGSLLFFGRLYRRARKTASYLVSFNDENNVQRYGIIEIFLKFSCSLCQLPCDCSDSFFALVSEVKISSFCLDRAISQKLHYMRSFTSNGSQALVPVHNIKTMLFLISFDENSKYLCFPANFVNKE